MDVLDVHACVTEALRKAREDREPQLVEAVTYRFRGHSMADPEEYRTKEQVEQWRRRDPILTFGDELQAAGVVTAEDRVRMDAEATARVDAAVAFADASPFPPPESLYDDIYVLGDQVRGWYSVDERTPTPHRGEDERSMDVDRLPHADGDQQGDIKPADEAQREED
jgi:TPP-dependent pyruvate/acetoin dehydrogenase alpha subunit